MAPDMDAAPPKDDSEYFDRMSKAIFTAGLNWTVVENKWPNFRKAFKGFSPEKVSKMTEKDVQALMKDSGIVRNEKKIQATIMNARTFMDIKKEKGSMKAYVDSFGKREKELASEVQARFKHLGPSTTRMYLWSIGYPLTPTKEEKVWMKGHSGHHH
jgi:DNA-3-methyladenine glycosylase I